MKEGLKMSKEQIAIILKKIFKDVTDKDIETLDVNGDLMANLGLTSIEALQIYVLLEREFEIDIEDDELSTDLLKSIDHLEEYIFSKVNN